MPHTWDGRGDLMDGADTADERVERNRGFGHGHDSFEPLGAECTLVTVGRPLEPAAWERLAGLMHGRPEIALRLHTAAGRDLEPLRFFPSLKRLSVDLYSLEDIAGFSHLQGSLEQLSFGKTKQRFSLRFLEAMPSLQGLSLEGHTKDIGCLRDLKQLRSLELRRITLPDLSLLTSFSELQTFSLALGSTPDIGHLAQVPKLEVLHLLRVRKLSSLSVLAKCTSLRILSVDSMANVESLPSLAALTRLESVELDTLKGFTDLSGVAAAPALKRLTVAGTPRLDAEAFRCLVGHPTLAELRIYPSLGGAGLKKPVLEAVKRLLPGVMRT